MSKIITSDKAASARLMMTGFLLEKRHPDEKSKAPKLYGQELNPVTYAMAKMNVFLHDYTTASIAIGDTFRSPKFAAKGAGLHRFDYVVANPMWNQDNYDEKFYDADTWKRFANGIPPKSSADWGWAQLFSHPSKKMAVQRLFLIPERSLEAQEASHRIKSA